MAPSFLATENTRPEAAGHALDVCGGAWFVVPGICVYVAWLGGGAIIPGTRTRGSVLVGPLGDPTKGGTEHGEVYIPAIIKIQMVHFNIIWPSRNDSWCPFSRPMWCSGRKTLAL